MYWSVYDAITAYIFFIVAMLVKILTKFLNYQVYKGLFIWDPA